MQDGLANIITTKQCQHEGLHMVEDKKSLKFVGQCNGAICEGQHCVYSFGIHHMVALVQTEQGECMSSVTKVLL